MKKAVLFILIFLVSSLLWAQNRYALVIGNANYPRVDDRLPNAINDTNDISAALRGLGYQVELRQNLQCIEMIRVIDDFIARLRSDRNSEGFFWYAGHAMEIDGENLLLPLDVNVESNNMIKRTSLSVNDMARELNRVRNKVNVVVLDACRVPPAVGGGSRSMGDTSRVLKTVTLTEADADLFIIYSTAPGTVASDGTGSRNSPFTQAFLNNINLAEPLQIMVNHVTSETQSLTGQRQRPHTSGSMGRENIYYSLNPAGGRPSPTPAPQSSSTPAPQPSPSPTPSYSLSLWEGAAAVAPEGELPSTGLYIATNLYPINTVVDITNFETNRSTEVIVAKNQDTPGLVAIVSREAAELIGMQPGFLTILRMRNRLDPRDYLSH